jgi:3'-phosphoadenosine 5'-phosphosulfate sulfotransferase (PAPS reductase)/FAD synthetase
VYENVSVENCRADKETRYAMFQNKTATLEEKEKHSINLLKTAFAKSKNPVISCSFGIDSVVDIYLARKALVELGKNPSDIQIIWNDTANEFKEVRQYQKYLTELWQLNLTITKPKKTLKHIIEDNGGITDDYFLSRKGDRRSGKPLSEKCCNTLKHEPMNRAIKQKNYDLVIVGLRADESVQRLQAGLRDGEYFYSTYTWKSFILRPILWWKDEDIWRYVRQENIPYNKLYDMNTIQSYETKKKINEEEINKVNISLKDIEGQNLGNVTREQAKVLSKMGVKVFTPRTGCMMCPIPIKYGYLQWMRLNYPKVYEAMVYNLGYGKALLNIIPNDVRFEIETLLGISLNEENAHEHLQEILQAKPCTFDKF